MPHRLDACIRLENEIGQLYLELGGLFPEARPLFDQLAAEEAQHADMLARIEKMGNMDELTEGFIMEISSLITEPLLFVHIVKDKIGRRKITLREALDLAMRIEKSGSEQYLQKVFVLGKRHQASTCFEHFHESNKAHEEMIRDFLSSLE